MLSQRHIVELSNLGTGSVNHIRGYDFFRPSLSENTSAVNYGENMCIAEAMVAAHSTASVLCCPHEGASRDRRVNVESSDGAWHRRWCDPHCGSGHVDPMIDIRAERVDDLCRSVSLLIFHQSLQ